LSPKKLSLIVVAAGVPIVVYWGTFQSMTGLWSTDSYRHGWVIAPVAVFLLWRDRSTYSDAPFTGSIAGVTMLGALVSMWMIAAATSVQLVEHLSVVAMIGACVLAMTGWPTFRTLWFPFAFLLFAVPMGGSIIPALMDTTASISVSALQALDVPALREGMRISLPGGTFEVVEACSGFNYLIAGAALGVLVAHLMFRSPWRQVCYVAVIIVVFIFINGLRAFVVMFVGSASKMHWLVGQDHLFFGWLLFLGAMVLMYWGAERFSDRREASGASP
jgi:exosortase A